MKRRSLFAMLLAPFVARLLPKPKEKWIVTACVNPKFRVRVYGENEAVWGA